VSRSPSAAARLVAAASRRTAVVLCYHGIENRTPATDPTLLTLPPDQFRAQIELLLGGGFRFVTVDQLVSQRNGRSPQPGLVALSFDDGMENNYSVLLPILAEYGIPATVYVATGLVGQRNPFLAGTRMMTHEELRTLVAHGVELGAHTVTHPFLSRLDLATCVEEMVNSRDDLEQITGRPVKTFAYPYSADGGYAVEAAAQVGFAAAVTSGHTKRWARFSMNRSIVKRTDTLTGFALKVWPQHDRLHGSRSGRLVRASTRRIRHSAGRGRRSRRDGRSLR